MLYPVYVHKDKGSAHSVTIPDFPGCFSAADDMADLPRMVQEAVEVYCEGEDMVLPKASDIDGMKNDEAYQGGFWLMVDIDLSRVNTKPVRLNISLPANLVVEIDRYAEAHHMTRSGLLAKAAQLVIRD